MIMLTRSSERTFNPMRYIGFIDIYGDMLSLVKYIHSIMVIFTYVNNSQCVPITIGVSAVPPLISPTLPHAY